MFIADPNNFTIMAPKSEDTVVAPSTSKEEPKKKKLTKEEEEKKKAEEELSDEDKQLKDDLETCVTRLSKNCSISTLNIIY